MKKKTSYLTMILFTACLLVSSLIVQAQRIGTKETKGSKEYKFSYASTLRPKPNSGSVPLAPQGSAPLVIRSGIWISCEQLGNDSKITAIEPLVLWNKNTKIAQGTVFIWDINDKQMLLEEEASFRLGYNKIKLKEPFLVSAGKEFLVGYQIEVPTEYDSERDAYLPKEYPIGCDYEHPEFSCNRGNTLLVEEKGNTILLDKSESVGNLALNLYFKNDNFDNSAPVVYALKCEPTDRSIPFSEFGKIRRCSVLIRNGSPKAISTLTLCVSGRNKSTEIPIKTSLASGQQEIVEFSYPIEAAGRLHLSVSHVDGEDNAIAHGGTIFELASYKKDETRRPKPLLEAFVAEWSTPCTEAQDDLRKLYHKYLGTEKEFNYYCIHDEDAFSIAESSSLISMINPMFYPSARVNRFPYRLVSPDGSVRIAPIINRSAWVKAIDQALEDGVSFYSIAMSGTVNQEKKNKISINIKVERLYEDYFTDNRLVVALVEDSVIPKDLDPALKDHRHPNVLKAFLNGIKGDLLTFSEDNLWSKTFHFEIPQEAIDSEDISNYKVIAFIARPYDNPLGSRQIFDSEIILYKSLMNNTSTDIPQPKHFKVSINDGFLTIENGQNLSYEIYDLLGNRQQEPLSQGNYILRLKHKTDEDVVKFIVY